MSKQLAISAAISVFATAAFALLATPDQSILGGESMTGAKSHVSAPALDRQQPALPLISR